MLPKKLKNFNLFADGENFVGKVDEITLPNLERKMEEMRPGGFNAPVDSDMGMNKLTSSFRLHEMAASVLRQFVTWPPAPTEQVEALEQLRALYNGARIHVDIAERPPAAGVDTEEDLARIRALLEAGGRYV